MLYMVAPPGGSVGNLSKPSDVSSSLGAVTRTGIFPHKKNEKDRLAIARRSLKDRSVTIFICICMSLRVFLFAKKMKFLTKGGSYGNKILYKNLKFFDKIFVRKSCRRRFRNAPYGEKILLMGKCYVWA